MKQFTFSLEKVLELRKYREQETKIELGRAVGVLTQLEQTIEAVKVERDQTAQARFSPSHGATEILAFDRYIQRLDNTRAELLENAAKAKRKLEEAREIYLEASRERKVLVKVKEHRQEEYRKYLNAEEIKFLDDISGGAPARKLASGT
ncbi:MAG: flagellar export protein FliJ [Treponema sp.]|jgi:flagellar FliJ protein|nr:flagellar export protein FliJ [Treponema sp.]